MLLVQDKVENSVNTSVNKVLLHHIAMDIGTSCGVVINDRLEMTDIPVVTSVLLYQGAMDTCVSIRYREMTVMPAVIAKLFLHRSMNTGTECSVVSIG